jgi:hypothetical protein
MHISPSNAQSFSVAQADVMKEAWIFEALTGL